MDELLEALISKLVDNGTISHGDLGEIRADAMMRREEIKQRKEIHKNESK